ncbi:TIGR03643 family protein [Puniceicoccales bacterium CK1056]|uniref:TIGR03643 family protein n=1 Tax=Oceanipulchritudo coccoides TaxID=2706888 RepID=A0A6B2M1U7_9BACT|nr:TIGR03643 family protein [Oceanipulchritudo coccoides]NDV62908.1 TIGR03643 family protein [Oceanipulchritudo coccoides]
MSNKKTDLTEKEIDTIVRLAWHDRTTFEAIHERTGLREPEVIKVMRRALKPGSFRLWRKRVSGRLTKHRMPFKHRVKRIRSLNVADYEF